MIAADLTRNKRAVRRDALAAGWILQSALDAIYDRATKTD
jgi:putative Holliday junction resolvase